jgi:hypothetical protein
LWVLALALLVAPTLGHMHRVVHGPHVEVAHEAAAAQEHTGECDHSQRWLSALFGHDEGDTGCRLYDQLNQSDSLPTVAALALPLVLSSVLVRQSHGLALVRWSALFDARGPPSLR